MVDGLWYCFLSFLGTVFNFLKNYYSIRRMLQYIWNNAGKFENIDTYIGFDKGDKMLKNMVNPKTACCKKSSLCALKISG